MRALVQAVSERRSARTVLTFGRDDPGLSVPVGCRAAAARDAERRARDSRQPGSDRMDRVHKWWLAQPGGWRTSSWLLGGDSWPLQRPSGLGMLGPLARLEADVVTSVNWGYAASFWVCRPRSLRRRPRVAIPILHIEREWANNPRYPRMFRDCDATIVCTDAERASRTRVAGARSQWPAPVWIRRIERRTGAHPIAILHR
jgi:hypothetical protein